MHITRKTVFVVDERPFDTLAKARDHVESIIHHKLSRPMIEKGFTVTECVKVTEIVLALRHDLAELLACEDPDDSEEA